MRILWKYRHRSAVGNYSKKRAASGATSALAGPRGPVLGLSRVGAGLYRHAFSLPIYYFAFVEAEHGVGHLPQMDSQSTYYGNYTLLLLGKPFLRWGFNTFFMAGSITVIDFS